MRGAHGTGELQQGTVDFLACRPCRLLASFLHGGSHGFPGGGQRRIDDAFGLFPGVRAPAPRHIFRFFLELIRLDLLGSGAFLHHAEVVLLTLLI